MKSVIKNLREAGNFIHKKWVEKENGRWIVAEDVYHRPATSKEAKLLNLAAEKFS